MQEMTQEFSQMDGYDFNRATRELNLPDSDTNQSLGGQHLIKYNGQSKRYTVLAFSFSFEFDGHDDFIGKLFIESKYRNNDLAKLSHDRVDSESIRLNANIIHLEVETHNATANKLYVSKRYSNRS